METAACPLCGATESQPRYALEDSLLGLPGPFHLVRCLRCGLLYQNPRLTPDEMASYYPPEYDPFAIPQGTHPLARLLLRHGVRKRWRLVERWAPTPGETRRILDVGCATGIFLAGGADRWCKTGVEPSVEAAALARQRFGLHVYTGRLEDAPLAPRSFDAVTMWDVLEHLHEPRRTLGVVRSLLRPGGIFVFRVPNLDAWDARLWGRYWAGLDQPRHLFVPDEAAIRRLLEGTGFVECERLCLSGAYGVAVLSCRFWLRRRRWDRAVKKAALRAVDHLVMRAALAPPLWVIDRVFGKGPLLAVVARPDD